MFLLSYIFPIIPLLRIRTDASVLSGYISIASFKKQWQHIFSKFVVCNKELTGFVENATCQAFSSVLVYLYVFGEKLELQMFLNNKASSEEVLLLYYNINKNAGIFTESLLYKFGLKNTLCIIHDGCKNIGLTFKFLQQFFLAVFINIELLRKHKDLESYVQFSVYCREITHIFNKDIVYLKTILAIKDGESFANVKVNNLTVAHFLIGFIEISMLFPDSIKNLFYIAEQINFIPDVKGESLTLLPNLQAHEHDVFFQSWSFLSEYIKDFAMSEKKRYFQRLLKEYFFVHKLKFDNYFLLVSFLVRKAIEHDILVGPGRGSGAGSLILFCLRVTFIDPVKHGLIFERFINTDRVSFPDVDIDFEHTRQHDIIQILRDKFGHNSLCNIGTYNTFHEKSILKDLVKIFFNFRKVFLLNQISKQSTLQNISLQEAIQQSELQEKDKENFIKIVTMLESMKECKRSFSVHASGVIVADHDISKKIPLNISVDDGVMVVVTELNMHDVAKLGYMKIDILKLKTLTVLKQFGLYQKDLIQFDDNNEFALKQISSGFTRGLFQIEKVYIGRMYRKLQPQDFNTIADTISLNRPGPLQFIPEYIEIKHKRMEKNYIHPWLAKIADHTESILIYQEQIIHLVVLFARFTLSEADTLRKVIGKKEESKMHEQIVKFEKGCVENGIDAGIASELSVLIVKFARYGFNKSHAACYAMLTMATAYCKFKDMGSYMSIQINEHSKPQNLVEWIFDILMHRDRNLFVKLPRLQYLQTNVADGFLYLGLSLIRGMKEDVQPAENETVFKVKNYKHIRILEVLREIGLIQFKKGDEKSIRLTTLPFLLPPQIQIQHQCSICDLSLAKVEEKHFGTAISIINMNKVLTYLLPHHCTGTIISVSTKYFTVRLFALSDVRVNIIDENAVVGVPVFIKRSAQNKKEIEKVIFIQKFFQNDQFNWADFATELNSINFTISQENLVALKQIAHISLKANSVEAQPNLLIVKNINIMCSVIEPIHIVAVKLRILL